MRSPAGGVSASLPVKPDHQPEVLKGRTCHRPPPLVLCDLGFEQTKNSTSRRYPSSSTVRGRYMLCEVIAVAGNAGK
jgi:hypothetical protein